MPSLGQKRRTSCSNFRSCEEDVVQRKINLRLPGHANIDCNKVNMLWNGDLCVCLWYGGREGQEGSGVWEERNASSWGFGGQTGRSIVGQTLGDKAGWGLRTEDKCPQHFVPQERRKGALVVPYVLGVEREGNVRAVIARTQVTYVITEYVCCTCPDAVNKQRPSEGQETHPTESQRQHCPY